MQRRIPSCEEKGIQDGPIQTIPQTHPRKITNRSSRLFKDTLSRSRIPLASGTKTRVQIGQGFGDTAEFQRAAGCDKGVFIVQRSKPLVQCFAAMRMTAAIVRPSE